MFNEQTDNLNAWCELDQAFIYIELLSNLTLSPIVFYSIIIKELSQVNCNMSKEPQIFHIKIGKRHWTIGIISFWESPNDLSTLRIEDLNRQDVFLVPKIDKAAQEKWTEAVRQHIGEDWGTQIIIGGGPPGLPPIFTEPYLAIGPRLKLQKFMPRVVDGQGTDENASTDKDRGVRFRQYPQLPVLSDIPKFPGEEHLDPFGLNPALLGNAWSNALEIIVDLVMRAHSHDVAVTLPTQTWRNIDPDVKPWRTTVTLAPQSSIMSSFEVNELLQSLSSSETGEVESLNLVQRCLVTSSSLSPAGTTRSDWREIGKMIEEMGYILVSQGSAMQGPLSGDGRMHSFFEIGALVADIHSNKIIIGDMDLTNFLVRADRPLGYRAVLPDYETCVSFNRPLTTEERARDLSLLKLQCDVLEWNAVRLGYHFRFPKEAAQVFQLI
jgi:hypothetical protein